MSVTVRTIEEVMVECERFMVKAAEASEAILNNDIETYGKASLIEVSAMKRASMDLTRALVFIRN